MKRPMPRLSVDRPHERHPLVCQACGLRDVEGGDRLTRWREHDDQDRPEHTVVVLCRSCAEALIEPHPRLYAPLDLWEPHVGSMALCVACRHRDGLRCTHGDSKLNGGTGLALTMPQPSVVFWDGVDQSGRRTGGRRERYTGPVRACAGRELCDDDGR